MRLLHNKPFSLFSFSLIVAIIFKRKPEIGKFEKTYCDGDL